MEQRVGANQQRRSYEVDGAQVLIILPNVRRLEGEVSCNWHIHGCDVPASARPWAGLKIVINLVEGERRDLISLDCYGMGNVNPISIAVKVPERSEPSHVYVSV
jgi:hypothetical protein